MFIGYVHWDIVRYFFTLEGDMRSLDKSSNENIAYNDTEVSFKLEIHQIFSFQYSSQVVRHCRFVTRSFCLIQMHMNPFRVCV